MRVPLVMERLGIRKIYPQRGISEKDGGCSSASRSNFPKNLTLSVDLRTDDAKLTDEYSRNAVVPVAMTK
jgi:hypothetical protein